MIEQLNALTEKIEQNLHEGIDIEAFASEHGSTGYHLRRMFSSLAGMPVSEYLRRRRMTVAAAEVIGHDDFLTIAVRYGYGSTEAFARAFKSVHGTSVADIRRHGGPLRSQPQIRFRLTIEGSNPMKARITSLNDTRLVGYATQAPLQYEGINEHIEQHVAQIPASEHERLKRLNNVEPRGILSVSSDTSAGDEEGSTLTYPHGVAVNPGTPVPEELDGMELEPGQWVVFRTEGVHPDALQEAYALPATEWFPSNPWRLRPGPSMVQVLEHAPDFSTATCDLWMPIEAA